MKSRYVEKKDFRDLEATWQIPFGRHYLDVFIWTSKKGLHANTAWGKKDYMGAYLYYPFRGQSGLFGEVHLVLRQIGAGYVAHELEHAVFDWFTTRGTISGRHNEPAAYLMSNATSSFWTEFYKRFDPAAVKFVNGRELRLSEYRAPVEPVEVFVQPAKTDALAGGPSGS